MEYVGVETEREANSLRCSWYPRWKWNNSSRWWILLFPRRRITQKKNYEVYDDLICQCKIKHVSATSHRQRQINSKKVMQHWIGQNWKISFTINQYQQNFKYWKSIHIIYLIKMRIQINGSLIWRNWNVSFNPPINIISKMITSYLNSSCHFQKNIIWYAIPYTFN